MIDRSTRLDERSHLVVKVSRNYYIPGISNREDCFERFSKALEDGWHWIQHLKNNCDRRLQISIWARNPLSFPL